MGERTPFGDPRPAEVEAFWQRFLAATDRPASTPQPWSGPFGDSVELADELLGLILAGTKRASAGSVAEFEADGDPIPRVGDLEIATDGSLRPRAVIEITEVRVGPLSSVDDQFAYDEGEGDRTRASWLADHTEFFQRFLPTVGLEFDPEMATIFQRFAVVYRED